MKKLATLLATSALALLGTLVAPTAQAADPYPQSVATVCSATTNSPVKEGQAVRVRVEWTSAGNASPKGDVEVNIFSQKDDEVIRSVTRYYSGKPVTFQFKGLKAGGYKVRVAATTAPSSVFQGYRTSTFVRVTKR